MTDSDHSACDSDQNDRPAVTAAVTTEKRQCNPEQLEHLARIRAKAIAARKKHAEERRKQQEQRAQEKPDTEEPARCAVTAPLKSKSRRVESPVESDSSTDSSDSSSSEDEPEPVPVRRTKHSARRSHHKDSSALQDRIDKLERRMLKMHYRGKYKGRSEQPQQEQQPAQPPAREPKNVALTEALAASLKETIKPARRQHDFPHPLSRIF